MTVNRRFTLVARPQGLPRDSDFAMTQEPLPALAEGEFLIRNYYASIDPAIRGWLEPAGNYMPPVPLGDAVRASTIGVVEQSRHPHFAAGQWVMGLNKIEHFSVGRGDGFTQPIDVSAVPSPTAYLSVAGAVGLTAWFGVEDVMQPAAGQTLLVSGAAGAVGSLVGQLAKRRGAHVVGIAGGAEKCARLIHRYGFDAAIDYRGKDVTALSAEIGAACPEGVDFVYENVGGACLDAALLNLAQGALVVICGLISEYNGPPQGARNIWQLLVKTATMRGYLISQYLDRFPEGVAAMARLAGEGAVVYDEHVEDGIDNALPAMLRLFDGSNQGKMILKLA
ncbi:NADP-dependent oxidoreductase [Sphingobium amiense]|uniref:NADP-dependent oxidoreductase n=1 Tax=Sphingobium amiense TaxID=135719 RepID=A0A494W5A4_9SPHN|nr:NADP-dependent oxidoreductase [Sphingobium amiense]BBD99754.1 NADP-dependent oxidoreductase [Sphingobium amiense]